LSEKKFGASTLPDVQAIRRIKRRYYVEKPVPGRQFSLVKDFAGGAIEILIDGIISGTEAQQEEKRAELEGLADGVARLLQVEPTYGEIYAILLDPEFKRDALRPSAMTYMLTFLQSGGLASRALIDTVSPADVLSGLLIGVRSLSDSPSISELLKAYRGVFTDYGQSAIGSQDYPTGTFGKGIGGSTTPITPNQAYCTKFTLSVPCVVKKVGLYISSGANGNVRCAIYDDDGTGGLPGTLLAESGAVACVNGWNDLTVTSVYLEAGTYWLAHNLSVTGNVITYDTVSGSGYYRNWTFGAFPNPFGSGASSTSEVSQRATYVRIKGYMVRAKRFTLTAEKPVFSVRIYSHVAVGNARVAIFDEQSPKNKKWEANSIALAAGWNEVLISQGTPSSLTLPAADYGVWCQYDDVADALSYTAGAAGDGRRLAQAYGPYPATISGDESTSEIFTEVARVVTWEEV